MVKGVVLILRLGEERERAAPRVRAAHALLLLLLCGRPDADHHLDALILWRRTTLRLMCLRHLCRRCSRLWRGSAGSRSSGRLAAPEEPFTHGGEEHWRAGGGREERLQDGSTRAGR